MSEPQLPAEFGSEPRSVDLEGMFGAVAVSKLRATVQELEHRLAERAAALGVLARLLSEQRSRIHSNLCMQSYVPTGTHHPECDKIREALAPDAVQKAIARITELERIESEWLLAGDARKEMVELRELLKLNASMLAHQTDLAREAEANMEQFRSAGIADHLQADDAEAKLVEKDTAGRALAVAAKTIFDVVQWPHQTSCPHGNGVSFPTHAWFCDDCFGALEDALAACPSEWKVKP